jgi:hypothetical protein
MEERKGFLTPEQQTIVDKLLKLKGVWELLDGKAIQLTDDIGLEKVKGEIVKKWGVEILPDIYNVIDLLFEALELVADSSEKE